MTYKMRRGCLYSLLDALSTRNRRANQRDVINYINANYGLKGTVTKLSFID